MIREIRIFSGILAFAVLAGCQSGLEITSAPVPLTVSKSISKERQHGTAMTVIRTYVVDSADERREVSGANCRVKSTELTGRVVTPARVTYPFLIQAERFPGRGKPASLNITCRVNGEMKTAIVEAQPAVPGQTSASTTQTMSNGNVSTTTTFLLTNNHLQTYPWRFADRVQLHFDE